MRSGWPTRPESLLVIERECGRSLIEDGYKKGQVNVRSKCIDDLVSALIVMITLQRQIITLNYVHAEIL